MGEVSQIEQAIDVLRAKLRDAEFHLKALNRAELALEEDISVKTNSLNIDNRCMQRRQQFKYRVL